MILDLELDSFVSTFTPNCVSVEHTKLIFKDIPESVKDYARSLLKNHWRFYAVAQTRGRCYRKDRVITIPVWAITKKPIEYKTWYVSHELAHAYDKTLSNHGPEFMEQLKLICPSNCIHFELGYKPRNAKAAGIMLEL